MFFGAIREELMTLSMARERISCENMVLDAVLILSLVFLPAGPAGSGASPLKKIYISYIKPNGVDKQLADRARERIEMALYENFGKQYRVLTDEDIRVMFKKAGELMATGCDAESCQMQMADAVDADEIIYGEVSRQGAGLKLSVRNLLRDRASMSVSKKSMAVLSFANKDLEHYCSEAAKKLIDPNYTVKNPAASAYDREISLPEVRIEKIRGIDIGVMDFTDTDQSLSVIMGPLKAHLQRGDDRYTVKNYDAALNEYTKLLEKIRTGLPEEKQEQMSDFTSTVVKRCDTAYAMIYKEKIERLDAAITAGKENGSEKELERFRRKYRECEEKALEVPPEFQGDAMARIYGTFSQRMDSLNSALAGFHEKKGDRLYNDYRFSEALEYYRAASGQAEAVRDEEKKSKLLELYLNKEKAVMETGRNYTLAKVRGYTDQAAFFNVDDPPRPREARKALARALDLMEGDLILFATYDAVDLYNEMARVLDERQLNSMDNTKFFRVMEDQEKWYRTIIFKLNGGGRERTIGGIIFVYVPGGSFLMGSPPGVGEADEHPRHRVSVDGFWIGKYEVTRQQFFSLMAENPEDYRGEKNPVSMVSWNDAAGFSQKFYKTYGARVRLPTEAEWEYACRAGSTRRYYWGDEMDDSCCWYEGNSNRTAHSVGIREPNSWGLYDMSGNVGEWCSDWYGEDYYLKSPEKNPTGPERGTQRVYRGGSWNNDDPNLRSAYRDYISPGYRDKTLGFRLVVEE